MELPSLLIRNARAVNRGRVFETDVLIEKGRFKKIAPQIDCRADREIDAAGRFLLPGVIDDQVHFREPGLTHKANIFTESRAAVAGGVTSFMEMPNTSPTTTTQERLAEKFEIGRKTALANYSFFMGAANDNLDEVLKTDPRTVCGIKAFLGSSTGNMLVDDPVTLERLFSRCPMLIATHCEDETTVRRNLESYIYRYGRENLVPAMHPQIRSVAACYKSSSMAVALAQKHGTRLHILHISTEKELSLFRNDIPLAEKRITAEVCVHHLTMDSSYYKTLGNQIKCNPAIKSPRNRRALLPALLDDRLDIIATDHAPHTREEKEKSYADAPSGLPLVQHSLVRMLEFQYENVIPIEKIVEKMCHAPAICFKIEDRGFLDEGAWADCVLVNLDRPSLVKKENLFYKCGWSSFGGWDEKVSTIFRSTVEATIVSGHLAFENGLFREEKMGERLLFRP